VPIELELEGFFDPNQYLEAYVGSQLTHQIVLREVHAGRDQCGKPEAMNASPV
jgi:hypothetical protein